jgi:hypothetical protein
VKNIVYMELVAECLYRQAVTRESFDLLKIGCRPWLHKDLELASKSHEIACAHFFVDAMQMVRVSVLIVLIRSDRDHNNLVLSFQ